MRSNNIKSLLVDADDTLWESSIYFERVIGYAQDFLHQLGINTSRFRSSLDEKERRRIPVQGYGSANFLNSLCETFDFFLGTAADASLTARLRERASKILYQSPELLDGVSETLEYLVGRHRLFLVTKGNSDEQIQKLELTNLRRHFEGVEVLPEKSAAAYKALASQYHLIPSQAWMIGNSPRSDINPAIRAGLNAVYIPHRFTWEFEAEEPIHHHRLLQLERFSDLKHHF